MPVLSRCCNDFLMLHAFYLCIEYGMYCVAYTEDGTRCDMLAVEGVLCSRHIDIQSFKGNLLNNNSTGVNRILNELVYDTYDSLLEDSLNWSVPVINFWPYYYPTWLDYAWWGWDSSNSESRKSESSSARPNVKQASMDTVAWYCERYLRQLLTAHPDQIVWGLIRSAAAAGNTRLTHYKISVNAQKLSAINNENKRVLASSGQPLALFYTAPPNLPTFPGVACTRSPPTGRDLEFAIDTSLRAGTVIPFIRITEEGVYIYQCNGLPDKNRLKDLGRVGSLLAFRLAVTANIDASFQTVFPGMTNNRAPFASHNEYQQEFRKVLGKLVTLYFFPYRGVGAIATPNVTSFRKTPGVMV